MNDDKTQLNQEAIDAGMPDCVEQSAPPAPLFHFTLVLAEVIFDTDKGIRTHRCQLFSKADTVAFPAGRLAQVQNSAAAQVAAELGDKSFKAIEVVLLNLLNLGWMTDEVFWGSQAAIPKAPEVVLAGVPQTDSNNVVPLKRP